MLAARPQAPPLPRRPAASPRCLPARAAAAAAQAALGSAAKPVALPPKLSAQSHTAQGVSWSGGAERTRSHDALDAQSPTAAASAACAHAAACRSMSSDAALRSRAACTAACASCHCAARVSAAADPARGFVAAIPRQTPPSRLFRWRSLRQRPRQMQQPAPLPPPAAAPLWPRAPPASWPASPRPSVRHWRQQARARSAGRPSPPPAAAAQRAARCWQAKRPVAQAPPRRQRGRKRRWRVHEGAGPRPPG